MIRNFNLHSFYLITYYIQRHSCNLIYTSVAFTVVVALLVLTLAHAIAAVAGTVTEIAETTATEIAIGIAATKTESADDLGREIATDASTHTHTQVIVFGYPILLLAMNRCLSVVQDP
jgi:hypothetical protein